MEEGRGGQAPKPWSPMQLKCLLGDTPSYQDFASSTLSLFPLTKRRQPVTQGNQFPGIHRSWSGQVSWGVGQPAGHLVSIQ